MSKLTFITQILGYDDLPPNSNPTLSGINRRPAFYNIPVDNPQTLKYDIAPGATVTIFNGTRTLTVDGTTTFSLTLSPANPTTYRLLSTGGTVPGFRTTRTVPVAAVALTLTVGANLAMTVTAATGTPFSTVQIGDTVLIPGVETGDPTSPFNSLNGGLWFVLTTSNTIITLSRDPSQVFSGISEVVTPASNSQFLVYSSDNVQDGDTVNLSAGFATSALHAFNITAVTPLWIEFSSATPLGNQTGILPTATGLVIYTLAKRFIFIETNQEVVFQINGDTGQFNKITPLVAGCQGQEGTFHKLATVWQLALINKATNVANLTISTAE